MMCMATGHMNMKRVTHRIKEELGSTVEVARHTSLGDAFSTLLGKIDIQIMVRNGHVQKKWMIKHLIKKHSAMNKYFAKMFEDFSKNYDIENVSLPNINEEYKSCVWVCWWQGLDNAPEIVKKCVESIRRNIGEHKLIVITEENISEFVEFPDWMILKYKKGIISKTHLSDVLRLELMARYGGLWLDSTFYCTSSIEHLFDLPVWSIKRPNYRYTSVACGCFANYSFGCTSENRRVFAIIRDYLLEYWKKYDYMIDYLFLDYLIVLVRNSHKYVDDMFANIPDNNPKCDELLKNCGCKYNEIQWRELKKQTDLFKLTWKADFPKQVDGENTFYSLLIQGKL